LATIIWDGPVFKGLNPLKYMRVLVYPGLQAGVCNSRAYSPGALALSPRCSQV